MRQCIVLIALVCVTAACNDIVPDGGPPVGYASGAVGTLDIDGAIETDSVYYLKRKERCGLPNRDVFELSFDGGALVISWRTTSQVSVLADKQMVLPDEDALELFEVSPSGPALESGMLAYGIEGGYGRRVGQFELLFDDGTEVIGDFDMPYEGRGPYTDCGPDLPDD